MKKSIVAYVMAKNEEERIESCVRSLDWCDAVIVADTGSLDQTKRIAEAAGANVVDIEFKGFGKTRNSIIDLIDAEWIVCFDADEQCTKELALEIQREISSENFVALKAPRKNFLLGKEILHSGWNPDYRHPVAFKKNCARYNENEVHEGLIIQGKEKKLKSKFLHYSFKNLGEYVSKSIKYSELGAYELIKKKKRVGLNTALLHGFSRFFRHYFFKLGFLDGWAGLVIASTSSYGTFMKYSRAHELQEEQRKNISKV